MIDHSSDDRLMNRVFAGIALIILLVGVGIGLAACASIPEHCRGWDNPRQCAIDHPGGEFFCDDTPELDPQRCGLAGDTP